MLVAWNLLLYGGLFIPWTWWTGPFPFSQLATPIIQNFIGSCKVTASVLNRLLIFASILLVSTLYMTSVVSIYLVGLTPSLVNLYMIIYTWCGRLNICLCIPICVNGIHIYVMTSLLLETVQTRLKLVQTRLMASTFLIYFKTHLMASLFLGNSYKHVYFYNTCSIDGSVCT